MPSNTTQKERDSARDRERAQGRMDEAQRAAEQRAAEERRRQEQAAYDEAARKARAEQAAKRAAAADASRAAKDAYDKVTDAFGGRRK